jgi:hypothetical protein
MGTLDQVTKMRKQGISDKEIISNLSQGGVSPREINDALKQAQIKNAVSDFDDDMQPSMNVNEEVPVPNEEEVPQEYEPQQESSPQAYAPATQEEYQPQEQQQYQQQEYQPQEYLPQQQYSPQENYSNYSSSGINTDTIIEITDQIFSDRIRKFQKQEDANSEAVALLQTKFENVSERLKKIETIIDKLQIAILEKIGSYGQNLEGIKKEMSMMQDSFSKMITPSKEMRKPESRQPQQQNKNEYYPSESENIKESLKNISKKK